MNNLDFSKKTMAISMLCEGSSIRSIERVTGIHRDTIMRLAVRVGEACKKIMAEKMRNLQSAEIQATHPIPQCLLSQTPKLV